MVKSQLCSNGHTGRVTFYSYCESLPTYDFTYHPKAYMPSKLLPARSHEEISFYHCSDLLCHTALLDVLVIPSGYTWLW